MYIPFMFIAAVTVVIPIDIKDSVHARFITFLEKPVDRPHNVMKSNTTTG